MKNLYLGLMSILCVSFYSHATILEHVHPVLQYDHNYKMDKSLVTSQYLTVEVEKVRFSRGKQREVFDLALSILEEVLNSESFKEKVLSYTNSDKVRQYQKNYLWNNKDERLTNEDVYNLLMKANEKMIPDTEGEMNIFARLKKCGRFQRMYSVWCKKVIGSTSPSSSPWMTLNWKFYRKYQAHNMVANIVHEWIHLLGFLHGKDKMREEVPYVVGAIAGEVAYEILVDRDGEL